MAKEEIVEGLRMAVSKGESLERAMTTFYNAGYSREDIEDSARAFQNSQFMQSQQPSSVKQEPIPQQKLQKNIPQPTQQQPDQQAIQQQPPKSIQQPPQPIQPLVQQQPGSSVVQRVSNYGKKPNKIGVAVTILLFILLLILLGVLAAVIIFKEELSQFFNNLFWATLL